MYYLLITCLVDNVLTLYGEIAHWSVVGVEQLRLGARRTLLQFKMRAYLLKRREGLVSRSLPKRAFKYLWRFVKSVVRNTVCAFVDPLSYLLLFQVGSLQNLLRFWTKEVKR